MYNRYIRNDDGVYRRIPVPEPSPEDRFSGHSGPQPHHTGPGHRHSPQPHGGEGPPSPRHGDESWQGDGPDRRPVCAEGGGKQGLLSGLLEKFKLDKVDSGDLLLLAILFLLFRDGGDEELLIALALLLIL